MLTTDYRLLTTHLMPKAHTQRNAGQLLIIGFDGTEMSSRLRSLLTRIQPAGVILFGRNIVNAEQTHELLRSCAEAVGTPLFFCVDMEGGTVDRLKNAIAPAPSAAEVFATGDRRLFRKHGKIIGESCRALGFNTDLAPVVDLVTNASRKVMRSRVVSSDPKEVVVYAREFLAGLGSAGVIGAIKHFPGLGAANLDTHKSLPEVQRPWNQLWEQDLYPYRSLRRVAPMILIGHASYPAVTRDGTPASLSKKWISEVLRKRIEYRGLVISDDLEMGGVLKAAPIDEAAVEHIRAGGDVCLVCHKEEFVSSAFEALLKETERDRKFAARVAESTARVLAFKKKSREVKRRISPPSAEKLARLSRSLWEFSEQVRFESLPQQANG